MIFTGVWFPRVSTFTYIVFFTKNEVFSSS